jgi:hypothetical protein
MPKITIDEQTIGFVKRLYAFSKGLNRLAAEAEDLALLLGREDFKRMMGQFVRGAKRDNGSTAKPEA